MCGGVHGGNGNLRIALLTANPGMKLDCKLMKHFFFFAICEWHWTDRLPTPVYSWLSPSTPGWGTTGRKDKSASSRCEHRQGWMDTLGRMKLGTREMEGRGDWGRVTLGARGTKEKRCVHARALASVHACALFTQTCFRLAWTRHVIEQCTI